MAERIRVPGRWTWFSTCERDGCCNLMASSRGPRKKWCSAVCYQVGTRDRETRKPPAYFPKSAISYATCRYCATLFVERRPGSRATVCRSAGCRAEHNRLRARELRIVRKTAGRSMYTPAGLVRRRAANSERRAKTRGAQRIERFSLEEIFERDGWRCGVCGRKVSKKPWPHLLSPTLDHVVPLVEGGEHTRANSRCAHLSCNSSRRDRGGDEQLRLIG